MRKIFTILIIILFSFNCFAVEKEVDKSDIIKKLFKGKKFQKFDIPDLTAKEKAFEAQLLKDFINQKGIEMIEPIAVGDNINSPEIDVFNKACPEKKPINLSKQAKAVAGHIEDLSEEELEDPRPEAQETLYINTCLSDMKIFKTNFFNNPSGREEYILYCEDYNAEEFRKEPYLDSFYFSAAYLYFDPSESRYSRELDVVRPKCPNNISGIFRYRGRGLLV